MNQEILRIYREEEKKYKKFTGGDNRESFGIRLAKTARIYALSAVFGLAAAATGIVLYDTVVPPPHTNAARRPATPGEATVGLIGTIGAVILTELAPPLFATWRRRKEIDITP